jgi:hypothetical protein
MMKHLTVGILIAFGVSLGCAGTESTEAGEQFHVGWVDGRVAVGPEAASALGGSRLLWVVGDEISVPLFRNREEPDSTWPDVLAPEAVPAGTRLTAYVVADGKLADPIADLVVDVARREAAYTTYYFPHYTNSTCFNYCESYCGNSCGDCGVCWGNGWACIGEGSISRLGNSGSLVCDSDCGGCSGSPVHHCWYTDVQMICSDQI